MSCLKDARNIVGLLLLMLSGCVTVVRADGPKSLAIQPAEAAQAPVAGKATRVLFIGNSYTYYNGGLGAIVQNLAVKGGHRLEYVEITRGGQTLEGHWKDGKALGHIKKGGWDYVVLQEHSLRPINEPGKMAHYVKLFDAEVKKVGAKTMLYETWARKNKPETQAAVCRSYETIAKEINAIVAPAGRAWEVALRARPELRLHIADWSHPTAAGSYLNGCVLYATIFGQPPQNLPRAIRSAAGKALFELPEPDAHLLQQAARDMLATWKKTLDVAVPVLVNPAPVVAPAEKSSAAAPAAAKRS